MNSFIIKNIRKQSTRFNSEDLELTQNVKIDQKKFASPPFNIDAT